MHNQNTDGQSFAVRPFSWGAALQQSRVEPGRTYYEGFSLNNQEYRVGDCVLLYPENDGDHYIGRINAAFCANDAAAGASDPHCIEVRILGRPAARLAGSGSLLVGCKTGALFLCFPLVFLPCVLTGHLV